MNRDGNQTNYAHPDVIAALQYWRDLGVKHKVMPEGTVEWGTLRQAFTERPPSKFVVRSRERQVRFVAAFEVAPLGIEHEPEIRDRLQHRRQPRGRMRAAALRQAERGRASRSSERGS